MDYEILLSSLQEKNTELGKLENTVKSLIDKCKNSINSISNTQIGELCNRTTKATERLKNGYNKCSSWLSEYVSGLSSLESSLAEFNADNIESPKEFKEGFEDLFGKKVIPTIKSNGDKNINLELGELNKAVDNAIKWAVATANDDTHGYSQQTRWGNPNYDCSALVISSWEAAGVPVHSQYGATYTGDMRECFLNSGQFEWIPGPVDYNNLQIGDVLLKENSHTEMYIGDGKNVAALGNFDGYDGDSSGSEINVVDYRDCSWDGILRYTG